MAFPGSVVSVTSPNRARLGARHKEGRILPNPHAYRLSPGQPTPGRPNFLRPHIALQTSAGILTSFPSTTHFCLALGADSPCADERCARKPWAFGVRAFHPHYRYSCQHSHFRYLQQPSRATFTGLRNALLPSALNVQIHSFGTQFEPRYIFRAGRLDQ